MEFHSFLIKYGEIGVKGKNRVVFEDALCLRIRVALRPVGHFRVLKYNGRIYAESEAEFDYDEVIEALQKVFGVLWICPVVRIPDQGYGDLKEHVLAYMKEMYSGTPFTFKVESRRTRKNTEKDSREMNADLGEAILNAMPESHVDVHHPEVLLRVEIRETYINIYSKDIKGAGGMPLGSSGKAMLLLSGGIDSPVAGYMIAKRGVYLDAVYFHAPPYTTDRAKEKVITLARLIAPYTGAIMLHVVNFTEIQLAIYEKCPHDELTIIMRRYMMKIAERLARENRCEALVTGESIGQVASQTMESLACTDDAAHMPVFRPLIAYDKQDIIDLSEKIGTYETSIEPYEDCCTIFVAKHPVTKPVLGQIEYSEKVLKDVEEEMIARAVETEEKILCEAR